MYIIVVLLWFVGSGVFLILQFVVQSYWFFTVRHLHDAKYVWFKIKVIVSLIYRKRNWVNVLFDTHCNPTKIGFLNSYTGMYKFEILQIQLLL